MKRLVAICIGLAAVLSAIYSGLVDQLMMFVIIGQVPFTNYSLGPTTMIVFWISLVPVLMLLGRLANNELWQAIETIGRVNQRGINIRKRLSQHSEKYAYLAAIVLIYTASQIPKSTTSDPELYFRRRFVVLPA